MANKDDIKQLKKGVEAWNAWRRKNRDVAPDFSRANLKGEVLGGVDFTKANLSGANLDNAYLGRSILTEADLSNASLNGADLNRSSLTGANLQHASLRGAVLTGVAMIDATIARADLSSSLLRDADLSRAWLMEADLSYANLNCTMLVRTSLERANLSSASLTETIFRDTDLRGANLTDSILLETVFANTDLTKAIGLEKCKHKGPSSIDNRTLKRSGTLPLPFLRGVGLPDVLIDYLPSLFNRAIQHYSCFISYSAKDQEFSDRIHADLQNSHVRCWFAPHDMPIGGKILDEIDAAIRLRDKVLLILSEHSIKSNWVEDEVTKAFEEERSRNQTVLFPIRLDDAVMNSDEAWASKLRARNIGDFRRWKDHDAYQTSFGRVLRDLTVQPKAEDE
jgi:uncharacterized protein YjbI with pentapeptide repeats